MFRAPCRHLGRTSDELTLAYQGVASPELNTRTFFKNSTRRVSARSQVAARTEAHGSRPYGIPRASVTCTRYPIARRPRRVSGNVCRNGTGPAGHSCACVARVLPWATGYNVVAIPLAAGVAAWAGILLNPTLGALLMSLSAVIVAFNAMLLGRERLD